MTKLNDAFAEQWRTVKKKLEAVGTEVNRVAAVDRSEVTGAVVEFASVGSLPSSVNHAGSIASIDGSLYLHDGSEWLAIRPVFLLSALGDITSPETGMLASVSGVLHQYDGSSWVELHGVYADSNPPVNLASAPTGTLAVDTSNNHLWFKADTWRRAARSDELP